MFNKILVPVDGSPSSLHAVESAAKMVVEGCARELTILHVTLYPKDVLMVEGFSSRFDYPQFQQEVMEKINEVGRQIIEKAKAKVPPEVPVTSRLENGPPAETICEVAEKGGFDLIVIGHRGLGRIQRLLLGSVSTKVTTIAPCSVLVIK